MFLLKKKTIFLLSLVTLFIANRGASQDIPLSDLSYFDEPSENWQISGDIQINPLSKESFEILSGEGILIGNSNDNSDGEATILTTKKSFSAMSLEFDFMLSHETSATIWLQKSYGIQLLASGGLKEEVNENHGAILPPNTKGIQRLGYLASNDAIRAPGIWQHIKITFIPPSWNEDGAKVSPAKFESVEINGSVIHQSQYLLSPSFNAPKKNEGLNGQLAFQVNRGYLALRNIHYSEFSGEQVRIDNGSYELYSQKFLDDEFIYWGGDRDGRISLPDLTDLEADEKGSIDYIHTRMVRGKSNDFALLYEGFLSLPTSGVYKFDIVPNGVGAFEIKNEELARWDALRNSGNTLVTQNFEAGKVPFKLIYYNFGPPRTGLFVEGPGIKRQPLHDSDNITFRNVVEPIILSPGDKPLIQRSFLHYNDQKLLSVVNVGYPQGIHYSYNFDTGGLIQSWRGKFGETTAMWHGRGEGQVLQPLGNVLRLQSNQQFFIADNNSINEEQSRYRRLGYNLNNQGDPIFSYKVADIFVQDHIQPQKQNTIRRNLLLQNQSKNQQEILYKVAEADQVKMVSDNLYSVEDNKYFIEIHSDIIPEIIREDNMSQLLIPINLNSKPFELSYSIIW